MIRFEIKDEVVKWLTQEWVSEPEMAQELIEELMGMMVAHRCIITPAPDAAALVKALTNLLAYVDRQADYPPGAVREPMAVKQARAALASVEQAN